MKLFIKYRLMPTSPFAAITLESHLPDEAPLLETAMFHNTGMPLEGIPLLQEFPLPCALKEKLGCIAWSATLHLGLITLSLFLLGGGSGGMGMGSGSDFGDGSGSTGFAVAGYVTLGGNPEHGNTDTMDFAIPAHQEPVLELPPATDSAHDSPATENSLALAEEKQPEETVVDAILLPSPLIPPKPPEKKQNSPERTLDATREKPNTKLAPPLSNKENRASAPPAMAASGEQALSTESGNAGANMKGGSQGTGGSAIDSAQGGGSGASGFGYALNMVDKKPQVLKRGPVPYPESARRSGLAGNVVLRFLLSEKGEISHLQVIHAEPLEVFNNSALTAIQKWKFSPAVKDGKAVPAWVELPLHFSLR
jgi:TonB family C-terminal domain